MPNLYMQVEKVNKTRGYRFGDSDVFESRFQTKSEAYRDCIREYGRCIGKCYIGEGTQIGWVFLKREKYDDCNEYFLCETWVTLHTATPTKTTQYHYA